MAYSCDTEPCQPIQNLLNGADVVIHEATGAITGHSSAGQAGQVATTAGAKELVLIHYRTGKFAEGDLCAEAAEYFDGSITLAEDLMTLTFEQDGLAISPAQKSLVPR